MEGGAGSLPSPRSKGGVLDPRGGSGLVTGFSLAFLRGSSVLHAFHLCCPSQASRNTCYHMHITHCGSASHGRGNASWPSVLSRQPRSRRRRRVTPCSGRRRRAHARGHDAHRLVRQIATRSRWPSSKWRSLGCAAAAAPAPATAAPAPAPGEAAPRKALASRDDGATSRASSPMNTLLREISRNLSVRFRKDETVEDGALDRRRQASRAEPVQGGGLSWRC